MNYNQYIKKILNSPLYTNFPTTYKKNGDPVVVAVGLQRLIRLEWLKEKKKELNEEPSMIPSSFFFKYPPLKYTVCKMCGRKMSIFYTYPSKKTAKLLNIDYFEFHDIRDIYQFHIQKINVLLNIETFDDLKNIITKTKNNNFSPGAMSNFPDRLDGYHSYNVCCRSSKDKGRAKSNMDKYNKDRRIYEYLVDGNIRAANIWAKNKIFENKTADHIGPISLGFRHESYLLSPMSREDNSAKNDRIRKEDVQKLLAIEKTHAVISEFAKSIWEIYKNNSWNIQELRLKLKQRVANYRVLMRELSIFFPKAFEKIVREKLSSYNFNFTFDSNGFIKSKTKRKKSKSSSKELDRAFRIAKDYLQKNDSDKHYRKIKSNLPENVTNLLNINTTYEDIVNILSHFYVS